MIYVAIYAKGSSFILEISEMLTTVPFSALASKFLKVIYVPHNPIIVYMTHNVAIP